MFATRTCAGIVLTELDGMPVRRAWRRYDTLDRKCRRSLVGGPSWRCERSGELRNDTSRTGAHRLLSRPKSVLSCSIGSCRGQSARAIRRRVVSGNYRNRPSETQTTSATIKAQQVACMSQRVARTLARDERHCARAVMTGSAISGDRPPTKNRIPLPPTLVELRRTSRSWGYACRWLSFTEPYSYKQSA